MLVTFLIHCWKKKIFPIPCASSESIVEQIYNANLVEVEQQHKASLVLVSPLQCCFVFVLPSGCNLAVVALPKKPVCMHTDNTHHVQRSLLSLHTPGNSQGRAGQGRGELGLEWNWNSITCLL